MKLDQATAVLRPRSAWEAVDLGCALARRHWGRLMRGWFTVAVPLWAIIILLCRNYPGWACFLIWLTKPLLTRQPVYFLSRSLFGKPPKTSAFLRDWKVSLWKGLVSSLTIRRLSTQRSFRLPVIMLEGQKGDGYKQRVSVLSAHGGGNAASLAFAALILQLAVTIGLSEYAGSFISESFNDHVRTRGFFSPEVPVWMQWMRTGFFAASIALIEPFYAAAGFALYINSRTHLEGWDIEVAFRRMSLRLLPAATAVIMLLGGVCCPESAQAAARNQDPKTVVQEVLKGPDFELSKYKARVRSHKWKSRGEGRDEEKEKGASDDSDRDSGFSSLGSGDGLHFLGYAIIAVVICIVAWLLWKNRAALRRQKRAPAPQPAGPRVVMGMDLAPESLPDDIPQTAWKEFQAGRHVEALRLLYRGSLAWLVDRASLPVHSSDTEGDCLRHARHLEDSERVSFFEYLTSTWINCVYAGQPPDAAPMKRLCDQWPFSMRGRRVPGTSGAASALIAISLTAASLLLSGCTSQDDVEYEERTAGYKGAAAVNPWLAGTRMLEKMGFTVDSNQVLNTIPAARHALFVPLESVTSRASARDLLSWAGRGGHLIIACADTDRTRNDWRDRDDAGIDPEEPLLKELNVSPAPARTLQTNEFMFQDGSDLKLESSNPLALDLHWRPTDVLAGDEKSAFLASFPWDGGRVTLLASAAPFRNRYIQDADNSAVLYHLAAMGGSDSFTFIFAGRTNLWSMLMQYAWMPLIATLLLVLLWLWRHLPVFGPGAPADQSHVRQFGTQLDEAGAFLSDRAGHEALLVSARRTVLQAAAQRGVGISGENVAENLAARSGLPVADINDALHNHSDSGDLITAAATLQKLQQNLGVTL